MRNFCKYCCDKYKNSFHSINSRTFSNGYYTQNGSNKKFNEFLDNKIGQTLELKFFLNFSFNLFNPFSSSNEENFRNFHLNKDNSVIIDLLKLLFDFNGNISEC
jgi:hypothetical protein